MTLNSSFPAQSASGRRRVLSRRKALMALGAVAAGGVVALTGCGRGEPREPPQLKGAALDAEIARLEAALARLPHVTRVTLEFTDNITNGQGFLGGVATDTNDQTVLDGILDDLLRTLWGTTAFYPDAITTTILGKDLTTRADYRALGAASEYSASAGELLERYGPPGFLLQTATTSASRESGAARSGTGSDV